jgi:para-nitrobenzyl esterase
MTVSQDEETGMRANRKMWRAAGRLGVAVVAVGALVAGISVAGASAAPAAPHSPRTGLAVTTTGGTLRGKTAAGTDEFLGIPYAAPPVGALRWRAPQPAARWHGVRDATTFAPLRLLGPGRSGNKMSH